MRWEVRTMRSGTLCFNRTVFAKQLARFWPIWVTHLVIWTLLLPLQGLMQLQLDAAGRAGAGSYLAQFAGYTVPGMVWPANFLGVLFGLLAAMAACSHLYATRSANFMASLPVRREGLFASHYLAGLVMVLGPLLATFCLTALVELAGGCLMLGPLGSWLGAACASGFFFYSFAVFLGMFTGHLLALPAFYLIFNGLAAAVMGVVEWALQTLYHGFDALPEWVGQGVIWLTPVVGLTQGLQLGSPTTVTVALGGDRGSALWVYPLAALLLTAGALLLYRRRALESAGDVVAVRAMRPVFQYGVALCGGLFFGVVTTQLLVLTTTGLMVSILLWAVAGYFIARMLLDKSFRVWRRWKGAVGVSLVLAALFAVVGLDLTGFETRGPQAQDVAEVTIRGLEGSPWDSGANAAATLDDPEDIAAVLALHQEAVGQREVEPSAGASTVSFQVRYQLRSGAILSRRYSLTLEGAAADQAQALRNDPEVILQSYGFTEMERQGGQIFLAEWSWEEETATAYGSQAQLVLDGVLEDIRAGRLGRRELTAGAAAQSVGIQVSPSDQWELAAGAVPGEEGTQLRLYLEWRLSGWEYGEDYYRAIEIVVPDTASSTLAAIEQVEAG